MTHKTRLLTLALLALPGAAFALGLGEIHLQSALNQPLSAQIELVGATTEELTQLRASIAPRETFLRYGIDRPAFLQTFSFKVARDNAGRSVLEVSSSNAVTEPFVTFLVELTWPRGKLLREYTLLLDPPVFEPTPAQAPPPVAAPVTGEASPETSGAVTRPAPTEEAPPAVPTTESAAEAPAAAPTPPAAPAASTAEISGDYKVVKNDTLGAIVKRAGAATRSDQNRMMIAIFRSNANAFDGNINRLHKGALLHIPDSSDYAGLSKAEARAEVHRQMDEWRGAVSAGAAPSGAAEAPRLKLVMPSETSVAPAPVAPTVAPAPAPAVPKAVPATPGTASGTGKPGAPGAAAPGAKPGESDVKRLMELKQEELSRLQGQASAPQPGVAPAPTAAAPASPEATPAAPAATPEKPKAKAPAPASPGFLDSLGNLGNILYAGLGLLVVAVGGLWFFRRQRNRAPATRREMFEPLARSDEEHAESLATTSRIAKEEAERGRMVVEESEDSGEFVAPPPPRAAAPRAAPAAPAPATEDTLSSETALNLEQADPLAEADFHMAYGLYDQAADIVKLAIEREPARRDLKLKLLEVYFVWGNKDAFLDVARDLGKTRDAAPAGEWEKVVIMGRQIAPEEALFAGAAPTSAGPVDLDLDNTGINRVDLELLGDADAHAQTTAADESVDLDLSSALGTDENADTGQSLAIDEDALDISLGNSAQIEVTQEMDGRKAYEPTVENPRIDSPTVESDARRIRADAPTIESPALKLKDETNPTIREKLDMSRFGAEKNRADVTSELSLDDLGFDVDDLDASQSLPALEMTDHPADAPTMLAGMDERSRKMLADAAKAAQEPTRELPRPAASQEPTRELPRPGSYEPTAELPRAAGADEPTMLAPHVEKTRLTKAPAQEDIDVDLDELSKQMESDTVEQPHREEARFSEVFAGTGRFPASPPRDVDLDVGSSTVIDRAPTVTERIAAGEMGLPELEPVTLSEVGTKLDLARAYMDMGDPEGAKSILQEVMIEGSASQKQEAQRLLGTLPG
jgi:pilus assembly protein FimV